MDTVTTEQIVVMGFDPNAGDILDISYLVETTSNLSLAIQDFVYSRVENGDTIVSADVGGTGTVTDIAVLQGVATSDITVQVHDLTQSIYQQQSQTGTI